MLMRRFHRNITAAIAAAALMLGATACGGDDDPKGDGNTPSPTATPSTSEAGGPPVKWKTKFTDKELAAYNAASSAWSRYLLNTEDIYRKGKDTPAARETLQEYVFNWRTEVTELAETYERGGVRVLEPPTPLWTMAQKVRLNKDGTGSVFIYQCTDYSSIRVTQNGKAVDGAQPKHLTTPLVIEMINPGPKYGWLVGKRILKDKRSCAG